MGFRLCPDFFALSCSMFLRAIKAVISRHPEPLNLSDFFILRYLTSVLIFVKLLSRMTVLSCQRSFTSKVLSPYCLRRLHFIEMRRSSCSWWGVSSFPHLLSAVIADQLLSDFSEVGKRESAAIARPISKNRTGVLAYPSDWLLQNHIRFCRKARYPRELFGFQ